MRHAKSAASASKRKRLGELQFNAGLPDRIRQGALELPLTASRLEQALAGRDANHGYGSGVEGEASFHRKHPLASMAVTALERPERASDIESGWPVWQDA